MERHDIQTAVKRNRHKWSQWRTEMNCAMVESMVSGRSMDSVVPLHTYLKGRVPHATDNPNTLLTYSAAFDNISRLHKTTFLSYGIPRVKVPVGRGPSVPERGPSTAERGPSIAELRPSVAEPSPDYPEFDDAEQYGDCPRYSLFDRNSSGDGWDTCFGSSCSSKPYLSRASAMLPGVNRMR